MFWKLIAWIASRPRIAGWIIERSKRTPYYPITSRDGSELYMDRWWFFNPYGKGPNNETLPARWSWLPSIRVHHILRADDDEHLHDHPWDARTIVLRGWYLEERPASDDMRTGELLDQLVDYKDGLRIATKRTHGYTGPVKFNQFHRIAEVSPGGVYTLWFTWKYQGTWGFEVDGVKVPYKTYLADRPRA